MKRRLLYASLSSALLLGLLYSCMREEFGSGESGRSGMLTIADARRHFERTYSATKSGSDRSVEPALTPGDFTPSWSNSTTVFDGLACVNTPILPEYSYEAVWHLPDRDHRVKVFQKYITVREPGSTLTDSYIMTLVPCGMFPRGVGDLGDRFQNCGDKVNYTGLVLYYHPKLPYPTRLDVYAYGKIERWIALSKDDSQEVFEDKLRRMSSMMSGITFRRYKVPPIGTRLTVDEHDREKWDDEEDFEEEIEDPVTGDEEGETDGGSVGGSTGRDDGSGSGGSDGDPGGGSGGGGGSTGAFQPGLKGPHWCWDDDSQSVKYDPVYVDDYSLIPEDDGRPVNFYYDSDVYIGGGGSGGGGSSGGGSGGNTISKYVRPRYLNPKDDIAKLVDELMDDIRRHNNCVGRALTNKLYNCHDLTIERSTEEDGTSYYRAGDNLIGLYDGAGSGDLCHELFHHAQAEPYRRYAGDPDHIIENAEDNVNYEKRAMNFEAEAWIMEYRYVEATKPSDVSGVPYEQWTESEEIKACKKASKMLDAKGNLLPGVSEAKFRRAFNGVVNTLQRKHPKEYGNKSFDDTLPVSENLRTLRELSRDC